MAVLLVLPQPQAPQPLRAAEFLQQRGPDGHPRASPLARAQFSVAPVLLERALPCSLRRPRKLQAAAAALAPAAPEPRKIEHAPRVRPLGAHMGRVAAKIPQL